MEGHYTQNPTVSADGKTPRAVSVPLTRNKTDLAAKDAICRKLTTWNYVGAWIRIL